MINRGGWLLLLTTKNAVGASTPAHLERRKLQSRPLFAKLLLWARRARKHHGPKTKIGKTVNYLLNHRRASSRFLHDPKLAPDNNRAERALRRVALGRKNFLFVGSKRAGQNLAILYSLVTSCEQSQVNPLAYLPDRWKPPDAPDGGVVDAPARRERERSSASS